VKKSIDQRSYGLEHAEDDVVRADEAVTTPQTSSPAYRLAFADRDFMLRRSLRPVRFQLELMKPEMLLAEHGVESTIVVFGSARMPTPDQTDPALFERVQGQVLDKRRVYEEARKFARIVSEAGQRRSAEKRQFVIVTGGGPGIMEAANRGAANIGAESIGLNIVLPHEQAPNGYITPELCFQFHYFAIRKMHFMMRALAMVCFPGGFGTMDELFEALTLIQTGKAKPLPLLLFDEAYWRRVIDFEAMVEEGVISAADLELFSYVESAEDAWRIICEHYKIDPKNPDIGQAED
jgi:uncharacterized protein (TIGR00730 family)